MVKIPFPNLILPPEPHQTPTPPSKAAPISSKNQFEREAWAQNQVICGVDEVGRGCLAGPLVTAAVILHPGKAPHHLRDSKLMTPEELTSSTSWVFKNSWFGYGIITPGQIDQVNIYQATLLAMKRAVIQAISACPQRPSAILVDAMPLKLLFSGYEDIKVHHFPKAESKSSSVAAASIIAKVKRDALMRRLESSFPGYHLGAHKGYATDAHCSAIRNHGASIIHRTSFLDKILVQEVTQLSLMSTPSSASGF